MSGFTIRRFVLQNITAVATHCPLPSVASAALGVVRGDSGGDSCPVSSRCGNVLHRLLVSAGDASTSKGRFGLVTPEEMAWIKRRRDEDAEESRVVLAARPTKSLLRGAGGGALNVAVGCLLSPVVFLSVTVSKMRTMYGVSGLLLGPLYGLTWAGLFFFVSLYAAVQQSALCFYYGCVAGPLYYCLSQRTVRAVPSDRSSSLAWQWSDLRCRFEAPQGRAGDVHPLLKYESDDVVLHERAMKRLNRNREKDTHRARYQGKTQTGEGDYYVVLGVERAATERQIKEAYNKLVLKIHPDRNPDPGAAAHFDAVTKAYRVLSNPTKRKKYDLGGTSGVEDLGEKKREGVRALFGGEALRRLVGDVFMGSFSQRVIDGVDHTQDELAVLRQRMYERCRDELLLNYLTYYRGGPQTNDGTVPSKGPATLSDTWDALLGVQLQKITSTGLAKEVLFTVGEEYQRVLRYYDLEFAREQPCPGHSTLFRKVSTPRLVGLRIRHYLADTGPHRMSVRLQKLRQLSRVRRDTFKNSEAMVDLVWYVTVEELERTARWVAFSILYDPSLSNAEALHRRDGLQALAKVFMHYGRPYKGASKATMDQLMNSLREYQHQKQQKRE